MIFNGARLSRGAEPNKNTPYSFVQNDCFVLCEAEEDFEYDIECDINTEEYEEALFIREYRPQTVNKEGYVKADIMCILADQNKKRTKSFVIEAKRNVAGADRVMDAVNQLTETIYQKNSIIMSNPKCRSWIDEQHIGLITGDIVDKPIIKEISDIDKAEKELEMLEGLIDTTVLKKERNQMVPQLRIREVLKRFLENKIEFGGVIYDLEIFKLVLSGERYSCRVEFR